MADANSPRRRVAIVGTVGLPAAYSGFETLAEHLVRYNEAQRLQVDLVVYCSKRAFQDRPTRYHGAELRYIDLDANNASSILYDAVSMLSALRRGVDTILLLGVSGAIALPFVRLFSRARIVTNIDGIEWRRDKWQGVAKWILRASEWLAVRFSHVVVADNAAIVDYVKEVYGADSELIAYGGDHALSVATGSYEGLPLCFALTICRIEPENNIQMILEAFENSADMPIVFIGNWDRSAYGRELKERFKDKPGTIILDPIYDLATLRAIREKARVYVHGHSAGGTNPSLVEIMHFGVAVFAFDCVFNRETTKNHAYFFEDARSLSQGLNQFLVRGDDECGANMKRVAQDNYTWAIIGDKYLDIL